MISDKSIINEFVKIGNNVKIDPFCNIGGTEEQPVIIGENVEIGSHCNIKPGVKLKDGVFLGNYVNLGSFVEIGKDSKIWHYSNLFGKENEPAIIGENTQIGAYSEIKYSCKIGNNCRFQSYVFVAEGVTMEDYVFVGPGVSFAVDKHPSALKAIEETWKLDGILVKKHAIIGSEVVINPSLTLGYACIIGTGATITKDTEDYGVYVGSPAKKIGMRSEERFKKNFGMPNE